MFFFFFFFFLIAVYMKHRLRVIWVFFFLVLVLGFSLHGDLLPLILLFLLGRSTGHSKTHRLPG